MRPLGRVDKGEAYGQGEASKFSFVTTALDNPLLLFDVAERSRALRRKQFDCSALLWTMPVRVGYSRMGSSMSHVASRRAASFFGRRLRRRIPGNLAEPDLVERDPGASFVDVHRGASRVRPTFELNDDEEVLALDGLVAPDFAARGARAIQADRDRVRVRRSGTLHSRDAAGGDDTA